jgi:histidine ammonia-lyase
MDVQLAENARHGGNARRRRVALGVEALPYALANIAQMFPRQSRRTAAPFLK